MPYRVTRSRGSQFKEHGIHNGEKCILKGRGSPADIARNPLRPLARGAAGLAEVEDDGEAFWTFVEKVGEQDFDERREGPGRDPRVRSI